MNASRQVSIRGAARGFIKDTIQKGIREHWEQKRFISEVAEYIRDIQKDFPKYMRQALWDYFDGMFERVTSELTMFAYKVDGKMYGTRNLGILPNWDTLPREKWDNLTDAGGIYWKDTVTSDEPKGFYINYS